MSNNIDSNPGDWNIDASWTLFLDRDGVINERIMSGYVKTIDEFHFLGGVKEAIKEFTSIFQYIFGTWLPNSTYLLADRPHFEVLGEGYKNNDPTSEEEIWIPIQPKS